MEIFRFASQRKKKDDNRNWYYFCLKTEVKTIGYTQCLTLLINAYMIWL